MLLPAEVDDVNLVAAFLADEELGALSAAELERAAGTPRADAVVLLGNSLLVTAERAFAAVRQGLAPLLVISGGVGHATPLLRAAVAGHPAYGRHAVEGRAEAEILAALAREDFGLDPAAVRVEPRSRNCGENAAATRALLDAAGLDPRRVVLVQDPTMQRRSAASFRQAYRDRPGVRFLSCPTFVPRLSAAGGAVRLAGAADRLWPLERFLSLVMGEIPRLRDDAGGYGPRGRGFIAHVDVPAEVEAAWTRLAASPRLPRERVPAP